MIARRDAARASRPGAMDVMEAPFRNTPQPAERATAAPRRAMLHELLRNLGQWCGALGREPRASNPPIPASAIVAIVLVPPVAILLMFFADAATADWARQEPNWLRQAFEEITNLGWSGWFLYPSGVAILCLAAGTSPDLPRMTQGVLVSLAARCGYLFVAIALPGLFTTIIKRLIGRARPYMDLHGDPFTYMPLGWRSEYASLPSGHATSAAAAAFAIGAIWPRSRWVMWIYVLIIMVSRLVVLAHHPSDVVVGLLVGAGGAALVRRWFAARGLVFRARDLSVFPGPSLRRIKTAVHQLADRPV